MTRKTVTTPLQVMLPVVLFGQAACADPQSAYERGAKAYQEQDLVTAMQALESAAAAGHGEAQALLGYILDKAEENEAAMGYYRQAADAGNPVGAFQLGAMYASGDGVARDYAAARLWFGKAAEAGYGPALEVLAQAHMTGALGLPLDRTEALRLLRRAAEGGYEPARLALQAEEQKDAD
jgi:TPR repeat protein